jgi:AraC-like DNA-binding protein
MNRNTRREPWIHFRRMNEEYVLYVIRGGTLYFQEDETRYTLNKGDCLLLEPGRMNTGFRAACCDYAFVHLSPDTLRACPANEAETFLAHSPRIFYESDPYSISMYGKSAVVIPKMMHLSDASAIDRIDQCMDAVVSAFRAKSFCFKPVCSANALEILAILSEQCADALLRKEGATDAVRRGDRLTRDLLEYLHAHLAESITSTQLENAFSLSFDHMNRVFRERTGTTLFRFLNRIRINRAQVLLLEGGLRIYEIAQAVGFCDEYHFSRTFKKIRGVSPKTYVT